MSITASLGRGGPDLATKPMALVPETAGSLDTECGGGKLTHQSAKNGHLILERDVMGTLTARALSAIGARDVEEGILHPVAFPAELSGTQSATTAELSLALSVTHKTAVAFQSSQSGVRLHDTHATLDANNGSRRHNGVLVQDAVAYDMKQHHNPQPTETMALTAGNCNTVRGDTPLLQTNMQVRRLTPRECERLQGFPDDYTRIAWRGKAPEKCPDGPRYKAMGNSMAVPVMRWIGERIQMVEDIT